MLLPMHLVDAFSLVLCLLVVWGVAEVVQKRVPAVRVERSIVRELSGSRPTEAAVLTASAKEA